MCATDGLYSWFRKTEVLHLAFSDQVLHRSGHIFNRHAGINTMLIEQVDHISPESFQRGVSNLLNMFWPAIETRLLAFGTNFEPEFRRDHHLLTKRNETFAHEFLVRERPINFCGVEKCDAAFRRCAKQRDHFLLIFRRAVRKAHSHAAESDRRYFQAALSKFALFHSVCVRG